MTLILSFLGFLFVQVCDSHVQDEDHAIYLSTIEMNISESKIEMVVKVFEDDLRDALRAYHGYIIDTTSSTFLNEIETYFQEHISINFPGSNLFELQVGKAVLIGDSYQIFMSVEDYQHSGNLKIQADYFLELFPTQQNILHLYDSGRRTYHIFKKGQDSFSYNIQN